MLRKYGIIFTGPRVCDEMLSHTDLFPTLCEYLGMTKPSWLTGKSFLPVLEGKGEGLHEAVFSEVTYHAAYEPKRAVRTKRYKYIRRFDDRSTAVLPNCDDGPSKGLWMREGWKTEPLLQAEELFDLTFDPIEHNNLAGDPLHAKVLLHMRNLLEKQMVQTAAPLLDGPVPLVAGGRIAPVDAVSPDAIK